jgi:hypothetical protein
METKEVKEKYCQEVGEKSEYMARNTNSKPDVSDKSYNPSVNVKIGEIFSFSVTSLVLESMV